MNWIRLILFLVKKHNIVYPDDCIKSVLCPGLGTAVGQMPVLKCANQMRVAYDAVMFGNVPPINNPSNLGDCVHHHSMLSQVS